MKRLTMLFTVVLLMTAMLVASAAPALAALRSEPKCCVLFEAPGWELVLDVTS
jgi:hypothetical protein